jgi:glycosyltransferase involved in cell wall biosynthesis
MKFKKIALVHDQLQEFGGAERVLVALKKIFPESDVFTSFYNPKTLGSHAKKIKDWRIISSWADKILFLKKLYSPFRLITPLIWEAFDFCNYDLVISSSGSYMSKGVITRPETVHICYLHHPPRYLYYYETAIEWQKYWPIKVLGHLINHQLRLWDYLSSQRVDYFIANSQETQRRIQKFYRRDATVIYPPVNIPKKISNLQSPNSKQISNFEKPISNFYLTVSRLARAKHVDVLIKAANKMKFNLKIVGCGRDEKYLKSLAGPTVEFLGQIPDDKLSQLYLRAKAFLFSAVDEEFGIAPLEAMGYGLPVIAYKSGGVPEYLREGENGFLFNQLSGYSLVNKVKKLESLKEEEFVKMKKNARKTAENFSEEKFKEKFLNFLALHVIRSTLHNNARIT